MSSSPTTMRSVMVSTIRRFSSEGRLRPPRVEVAGLRDDLVLGELTDLEEVDLRLERRDLVVKLLLPLLPSGRYFAPNPCLSILPRLVELVEFVDLGQRASCRSRFEDVSSSSSFSLIVSLAPLQVRGDLLRREEEALAAARGRPLRGRRSGSCCGTRSRRTSGCSRARTSSRRSAQYVSPAKRWTACRAAGFRLALRARRGARCTRPRAPRRRSARPRWRPTRSPASASRPSCRSSSFV